MKMKKKGYAMGGMKKGYAMGGMKKKMKAGGGVKKFNKGKEVGGQQEIDVYRSRALQSQDDQTAAENKFAQRGRSGRAEGAKQARNIRAKAGTDNRMIDDYGVDAQKARSFGQKTQPKQGKMKGNVPLMRKTAPGSDTLTTKDMSMNKKGGSIKKMKAGGTPKKKGFAPGGKVAKKGKAKGGKMGGKSKVRGAGIAQRGVRPAKMR